MSQLIAEIATCRARLLSQGADYELVDKEINGIPYRFYKNAPKTMRELVDQGRAHGDKVFLHYEGEEWTFKQLYAQVDTISYQLVHRYRVKPGDRIAIAMRNYPEWMSVYLAVVSLGAVVVPLNSWWLGEELKYGLHHASVKVVFCDQQRYDAIADSLAQLDLKAVTCRATTAIPHAHAETLETFLDGINAIEPTYFDIDSEDPVMIMYTSGTTDRPKGVISNHRSICQAIGNFEYSAALGALTNPEFIQKMRANGNPPCLLLAVPLFHVSGCYANFLTSLRAGRKLVLMYKWNAAKALSLIAEQRVTALNAAPSMIMGLLEHPDFDAANTASLLTLGSAGSASPPRFKQLCRDKIPSISLGTGYGMTESNAVCASFAGNLFAYKPDSGGLLSPLVDIKTCDSDGIELPKGAVGEIWLRSPTVACGYLNAPESSAATFAGGWLATGDIGYIDAEDFVFLVDRVKEIIVRGGENISALEVESCLYDHPAIREVAVFSIADQEMGEAVAAAVNFKPGESATTETLHDFVASKLAAFKVPSVIFIHREPFPRNALGKLLKNEIKARCCAD